MAALRALAASSRKQLAILYGRRQVGKTYLLTHAWEQRANPFYFLAADFTSELNRQALVRELAEWSGQALEPEDLPGWRAVFRELMQVARERPVVAVIDEFQYLLEPGGGVTSELVAAWDRAPQDLPFLLVLSGSEVSTMAHLHAGSEPLFGRVTWSAELQPFDYVDAARMAPWLDRRSKVALYGIFGGTPRFLAALRPGAPLADEVCRTFVDPSGEVHLQLLTLIEQVKGIRDPAMYRSVLTLVASGYTEVADIAQVARLDEHHVRRVLGVLGERLGLVRAERNFAAGKRAPFRYRIADPALMFWHRFVLPNRGRLARATTGSARAVWDTAIAPHLDTYLGGIFETIVRQALRRFPERVGISGVSHLARWEGLDRARAPVEIDLVGEVDEGRLLVGEVKWSSSPCGPSLHVDLVRKVERLALSGQGWANRAADAIYVYVSAAGFTNEFQALARADSRIRLLTLADLYPEPL